MKRHECGLLPYIREDIHGLSHDVAQIYGWQLTKFNVDHFWDLSMGENVVVAVIDTGIDLHHPDIKDNVIEGKNFVNINEDPIDRNGHGTHVAGTIAAIDNGVGVVGVAPRTKIMPIKALGDDGSGDVRNICRAVEWASNNKADFITMSLGANRPSDILEKAIDYANNKGSIVFCAAGNSGEDSLIAYPANYNNTIAIGAIDKNFDRTSFTCSGDSLDFLAPGHEILSCVPNGQYAIMSGTSMSNPFAVGCAALALSLYKKHHRSNQLKNYLDYINLFKQNAIPIKNLKYRDKKYQGFGIINPISL